MEILNISLTHQNMAIISDLMSNWLFTGNELPTLTPESIWGKIKAVVHPTHHTTYI